MGLISIHDHTQKKNEMIIVKAETDQRQLTEYSLIAFGFDSLLLLFLFLFRFRFAGGWCLRLCLRRLDEGLR